MLSDVYCQVALLRYQEAVAEGQHQQLVWGMWPAAASPREVFTAIQQRLGTILMRGDTPLQVQVQVQVQVQGLPLVASHAFSSASIIS